MFSIGQSGEDNKNQRLPPHPPVHLSVNLNEISSVAHSMGLDKGLITYIHHYNVIQSIFTAYKNCSLYSFPPNFLATNDFSIVSIVLLFFPEWHILGIYFSFSIQSLYKVSHGPPMYDQTGWRWQVPLLNTVAFLPIFSPIPLVLPSSHMEVQGMCWVFVLRKAASFVPLVTMNLD